MNTFKKIDKKNKLENTSGCSLNEQDNNNIDIGENNNKVREIISDYDNYNNFSVSCFSPKEFLKIKDNKNLFKINNIPRKIRRISLVIY